MLREYIDIDMRVKKMETKFKNLLKDFLLMIFLCVSAVLTQGCVFLDRPSPPEITGLPYIDKDFTTLTVVRKKQHSTSGTIFTLAIDDQPFVHLKHGEYTTFRISPENHEFSVIWDMAGFAIIAPFGGALGDSPHQYIKGINIQCEVASECFITVETRSFNEFVKKPEDGVIIKKAESLDGDYTIMNKKFIQPVIWKK